MMTTSHSLLILTGLALSMYRSRFAFIEHDVKESYGKEKEKGVREKRKKL
jgi:hypothetical protein